MLPNQLTLPFQFQSFHLYVINFTHSLPNTSEMDWTRGRTIGRGSTATVSIATADHSGHVFAVKSSELSKSGSLRREQGILSTLSCPEIIAYKGFDISSENGKLLYNLFMEYAPRGTLMDAIRKQQGGLDETMVRSYTRRILLGLQFLHSSGIVHCDIKGQNILVTDDGVKIADLGCARSVTAACQVAGTPVYMAPEVARGEQQGFPADVWALGCTVIEMATGKAPWPDVRDPVSALYRIGFSSDVPEIPSNISKQGKDFLTKCLKRDPVERWSVNELLEHEFVKETDGSQLDSPYSVLQRQLWDSMEELDTVHQVPLTDKSEMERIRKLGEEHNLVLFSSKLPNWEWDENWLTVRSNGSSEVEETLSDRQDDSLLHADESAISSCGGHISRVSEDSDFLFDYYYHYYCYPTKISGESSDKTIDHSGEIRSRTSLFRICKFIKLNFINEKNPFSVQFLVPANLLPLFRFSWDLHSRMS